MTNYFYQSDRGQPKHFKADTDKQALHLVRLYRSGKVYKEVEPGKFVFLKKIKNT